MFNKSLLVATILFAIASPAIAQQTPAAPNAATSAQASRPSPFERLDANRDGVITLEEVRVARTTAFTRLDVNRDGFLVRDEMPPPPQGRRDRGRNKMQGPELPQSQTGRVVSRGGINLSSADANNDGTITRAEFNAAYEMDMSSYPLEESAAETSMFNFLDTDKSGGISQAEVEASNGRSQSFQRTPPNPRPSGDGIASPRPMRTGNGAVRPNPDTNNDQKISLAEWLARPDPLFERGDLNKDGRITREEAASFVREGRGEGGRSRRPW